MALLLDPRLNAPRQGYTLANSFGAGNIFPLKTSIVASKGSQSLSYTGATTKTFTDHEGIIRTALSGEVRFNRARRVENEISTKSEDISNAAWSKSGSGTSASDATTLVVGSSASLFQTATQTAGKTKRLSFKIKGTAGNKINAYILDNAVGNDGAGVQITLTASYVRYSVVFTYTATKSYDVLFTTANWLSLGVGTTNQTVNITEIQLEDITGQAITAPSEYVSKGVLSAPYHGANVDGVKYFDTANGNTVSSNVVTEATGAALTDSSSDPIGYLAEPAATNLTTYSEDISNAAWTAFGTTKTSGVTGPDGRSSAYSLIEDSSTGEHRVGHSNMTVANATVHTVSFYAKAAGRTRLRCYIAQMNNVVAFFQLSGAGSVDNISGGTAPATSIRSAGNGWYLCTIKDTTTSTGLGPLWNNVNSGTTVLYTGDGASGIALWGFQIETGSVATSYIPTTSATVTRNADTLTAPLAVYSDTAGAVSVEAQTAYQSSASAQRLVGAFIRDQASTVDSNDGTNTVTATVALSTKKTLSNAWGNSGMRVAATGATAATGSYDGGWNGSGSVPLGRSSSDTTAVPTVIRNVKFWQRKLADAEQNTLVGN